MDEIAIVGEASLTPVEWDELAGPGECFATRRFLGVSEATSDVAVRYLLGYDDGKLSGALATALALPSSPWLYGRTDTVLEFSAGAGLPGAAGCLASLTGGRAVPRTVEEATRALAEGDASAPVTEMLMPSLVCGGRHVSRVRALTREDGDARHALLMDLLKRAEEVAAELGARSIAFLYVDERDTQLRRALAGLGYATCESGQSGDLTLPDGGWDGYKAMLPRKRRQVIASERQKLAAAGVDVSLEPLTADMIERLADLESQLFSRHGGSWTPRQSAQVFSAVLRQFGRDAMVAVARMDGQLCGFSLVLRHLDDWCIHRAGFDYERIGNLPVYFEVTYNTVIERAASQGVRAVHYGLGATRAKRLRGCTASTMFLHVKRI